MVSVPIVGYYLAEVFFMHKTWLDPVMNPLERLIYLLIGIEPQKSMTGREYAIALLLSNTAYIRSLQLTSQ
ncbi:potassium-transporting ATPase subunit KdpA [Nostoc sp. CHAB 5784]|uniref:potassium-transporting ATPase subunit KdpA n=1 Tax=Nostoc mirabile TaxID=2907820 RepID=UPI001E43DC25|nr:potassium-transporting ATPase subunit KdpA [Nostoc mirabile]MCC5663332.1 potassium-transporting ATPase subunit KdpA [Nostoc mirabile CHAB5784]